ncbi:MAG: GNAT family N-acetyltransferase [Pseudomonadota bacterium]
MRVLPAGSLHAREMADLLNAIIRLGGTTALTTEVTSADLKAQMAADPGQSAWHVSEDMQGHVLGFQYIVPDPSLPEGAVDIATFVKPGKNGMGIGSALFEKTKSAARSMGYTWINANIRSDNESGLTYYRSRGFEPYATLPNVRLASGLVVEKTLKRYDL